MPPRFRFIACLFLVIASAQRAPAWGLPHYRIVEAAAAVLPDRERWEAVLGPEYHRIAGDAAKNGYVFLPDEQALYATYENRLAGEGLPGAGAGSKWIDCFPYDYLMLRRIPQPDFYIHHGPQKGSDEKFIRETGVLADRVLLALRTETPREACLWAGSLIHWVSHASALAHASEISVVDGHTYLDRCLNAESLIARIAIPEYRPTLLGEDDLSAIAGIRQRTRELLGYCKQRGDTTKPFFEAAKSRPAADGKPHQPGVFVFPAGPTAEIEALAMEAALEGARACADILHTVFTLGLAAAPGGGSLSGKVDATPIPTYENSSSLVSLLDAERLPPGNLTHDAVHVAATRFSTHTALDGTYRFHGLPAGRYRALAYKVGSEPALSEPFTVTVDQPVRQDVSLSPASPPGNLVWNPEFRLGLIHEGMPDRWLRMRPVGERRCTISAPVTLDPGRAFRVGLDRHDPDLQATVIVFDPTEKGLIGKGVIRAEGIPETIGRRHDIGGSEIVIPSQKTLSYAILQILSDRPVAEAVGRVWIVPTAGAGTPAAPPHEDES